MILTVVALVALHEAGHALAAAALGYRPSVRLRLRARLPRIVVGFCVDGSFPRLHDALIALAGPAASLAAALALAPCGLRAAAGLSVVLAAESLLPLPRHDGLRAVRAALR